MWFKEIDKLEFEGETRMSIRQAVLSETSTVKRISEITISEIYPHYYPNGAVEFFLNHHSEKSIIEDIESNRVFLCLDREQNIVGTVTINKNEICRLFVLPTYQGYGYGTEMLDYAEKSIKHCYSEIVLDASLPAKKIYRKRGYTEREFKAIQTSCNDFLCYDVMVKKA